MKKWLKSAIYIPKHAKPTDENILRLILPSIVGIIFCMICLAGTTWAWFSANIQTRPQTIKAANYDIEVSVKNETGNLVSTDQPLEAGQAYQITLTARGTADKFGGYCIVEGGGKTLYSDTLLPGEKLNFTLAPDTTAVYTFTSEWGSHSGEADITEGSNIGHGAEAEPEPKEPEVQQAGGPGQDPV